MWLGSHLFSLSNYQFSAYAIPTAITSGLVGSLGLAVLLRERASRVSVLFLLLTLSISVWLFAFSWMYCAADEYIAWRWAKIAYLGVPLIPSAIYHFTVVVLSPRQQRHRLAWVSWACSVLFGAAILSTDALISRLTHYWWGYYPQYGWLSIPYLAFFFGMMISSLRRYWTAYRHAEPGTVFQQRTKLLLIAFGIVHIGSVDYIAKYGIPLYPFGYVPVLLFIILVTRVIWRYQLVDITPAFAAPQIINTMANALLVLDRDGIIRIANDTACAWFGRSHVELVGRSLATLEHSLLTPAQLHSVLEAGAVRDTEVTIASPGGTLRTLSMSASAMEDRTHQPLGIVCVLTDITERKRAEQALQAANEQLAEMAQLVESSQDAIIGKALDGTILSWNKGAERLYGYSAAEALGQPISVIIPAEQREALPRIFERLGRGESIENYEAERVRKDGTRLHVALTISPTRDATGRVVGASAIARDITERIQAEQQLKRAHTDLKKSHDALQEAHLQLIQAAKLESVGRLAAGIAHEVKNPLAVILQGVDYLSKHLHNGHQETNLVLQYTRDAIQRADAVIRGLLDFSTTRELTITREDINQVIEQALLLVKHELDRQHITVEKSLADHLPTLSLDRHKMEQVFVNILMNAIHAMPQGGSLTIKTWTTRLREAGEAIGVRKHDRLRIGESVVITEVSDRGAGIPTETLQRVFDPFFTTKPTGQGTGLGLTVSQKIVELHGGVITLRNRQEGGAKATVILRVKRGEVA